MSSTTFIYALCEPGTRTVRYIGKSDTPASRFKAHLCRANKRSNHRECWVYSCISQGREPELIILREVPKAEWKEDEKRYIQAARMLGMDLVNGTDGGDGLFNPSKETRGKISAAMTGRIFTPEWLAKLSATRKGRSPGPETRKKIGAKSKGRRKTPEAIAACHTPEANAKRSASLKGGKHSPETVAKRVASIKRTNEKKRAEHLARISLILSSSP